MNRGIRKFATPKSIHFSRGDIDQSPTLGSPIKSLNSLEEVDNNQGPFYRLPAQTQINVEASKSTSQIDNEGNRYVQSLIDIRERKSIKVAPVHTIKKYSIQERIRQVQHGSNITNCLSNPQQYPLTQDQNELVDFNLKNNYKKLDDGSLEVTNKELLKKQKQVLGFLIKQFGSAIMSGKSIMTISLPVSVFEPRSLLERLADTFVYAPVFLEKAGTINYTFEQFKLAFTFYLSTLIADLTPEKPFNPILGETFQGVVGGCPIYIEQISHHPPIAAFQMYGKNFRIEGTFEFHAAIGTNSVKCRKIGEFKVSFKNTGTIIQVQFPIGLMSGTAFGKRTFQYQKKLQVYDLTNHYYCEVDFEKSESSKKRKEIPGYFSTNIFKFNDRFLAKIQQEGKKKDCELKFKEKDHALTKLDKVEGSWLGSLTINDALYWSYDQHVPPKLEYFENPLPSDSNFRLDILHLKTGDELKSQDKKVAYEDVQRKDQKLREQFLQKKLK